MRTVRYIRTIIALLILLLYGTGEAWADLSANNDIIIKVMPSETEAKGSVTATEGSVAATVSGRVVTLTVTPGSGYKIRKNLIVVEKMVDPGRLSARRRAPGIGTFELTGSDGWETGVTSYTFEIPAEYDGAYVTATFVLDEANIITSLEEINDPHGTYKLSRDIDASGLSSSLAEFSGTLDGGIHTIYNLSVPLFSSLDGGTVKNLMLDNVNVNVNGNAGAIANEARGAARIYNCGVLATGSTIEKDEKGYDKITSCSSTVRGSNYVGGIVGLLDGSSRVINCFSYANITSGNYVGGIVGYNNVATTSANLKTMVMNCMFYGDITGGTNKAPIYNGERILNEGANGVSNFNYFCGEASYVTNKNIDTYNCALMAEARFLQRFEFFRNLLNSHRELAAWWATDDYSKKDEMLKWVLEPSQIGTSTPYPILKTPGKYASVVNIDVNHSETIPTVGTTVGTLGVTVRMGGGAVYSAPTDATITNGSLTLNITDKDPEHFNFNYRKVQLPYYNDVGTKNYTENRVVTGWKIVEINGGTSGSFTTGADATTNDNGEITASPYNFADRNCTNKDLYSVSNRVFNQGAYWDVPEGVSSIVIEPYWGKAAFLADATPDVVYNAAMTAPVGVPNVAGGTRYTNGNNYTFTDIDGNSLSLKVYTSITNAKNTLDNNSARNVYDCAVVLVGNAHNIGISSKEANRSYTIMSADFDHDNEPDYSYTLRFDGRNEMHPVRVDFLNIPGLGMAQKSATGTGTFNFGIMQPNGWFESTNTSLFRVTQFEYDRENRGEAPLIVQGGVMEQWVSGQSNGVKNTTTYFHVGGNVWFKEFHRGSHQDKDYISKHPPVSVTGGDYAEFYLTGLYRGDIANYQDNAECYINGGRFGTVAGAAQEGIGKTGGADNTGNIVWQIQNAEIKEFYGGGLNAAHPVEGNITTVITGGYIKQFCGGPKFGDMNNGKTVKTTANGTQFDTFYGAGYGGNSYSRFAPFNINNINGDYTGWNTFLTNNYKQEYNATYKGVSVTYNTQYLPMSNNNQNVARLLVDFVSFSLARTHGVTSTLTGCTINEDFYGGGNLGKVEGNINSTLQNCTVKGNVYGAGYGGSTPTVEVINTGDFVKAPFYDENLGVYFDPVTPAKVDYRWEHRDETVNSTDRAIDKTNHILYTNEDLTALGTVTGTVTLNINGTTTIGGNVDGGNVYGGGALSDATSDVQVNVNGGEMVNVYGGGKGQSTVVSGDVVVNIGAKDSGGALSGTGSITGDVYGGSAFGAVNATKNPSTGALTYTENKKTDVNIYKGSVTGSVFGGGLGQTTPNVIAAQNFGSTTITMEDGTVSTAIYGGANTNGVLKQDATITIIGGTVGTAVDAGAAPADAVFGGGKGEPTLVEGNVTVNIGRAKTGDETENVGTAIIHGNVYGGSALGNTNATKPASDLVFDATKKTNVNLLRGTINGNVFGGGLGQKNGVNSATSDILSYVGGDVKVLLDGAKVTPTYTTGETPTPITGQIFGCNNLNGTPKGHVIVHVKRTEDNDKPIVDNTEAHNPIDRDARDAANKYDVAAVYGGGNQADYIPTDATLDPDDDEGNPLKIEKATAEVIIEGCDRTSIEYVYGGGNAAAVPATDVTILGSYIIKYVFGGGNGKSTATFTNPGANIGTYTYNNGTTIYGTGKATTKLVGGHIIYVFGGSDTKGNVRGGTSITMPETSIYPGYDCCNVRDIKYIYGAGNQAEQDGAVTLVLGCVQNMDYVYGGARKADVKGGVDLVITSGHFKGVFGGNDLSGTIQGPITLTIEETGCDPLEIDNLYLGGNQAAYSVYGYKDDGTGNLVARTSLSDGTAVNPPATAYSESQLYRDPILNIVSCTRIGKESGDDLGGVFGGGYGAGAIMYGSPTVNVNMIPGKFAKQITRTDIYPVSNDEDALGIIRNVYGGGEQANVQGNTTVNICTEPTVTVRSSMGAFVTNEPTAVQGALITENVFGAGKGLSTDVNSALVTGNTAVTMAKGSVAKSVYGGGQLSQVGGNTTITVSGGTIGTSGQGGATYGNIYGGGFGDVTDSKFGLVQGNTNITVQNTVANAEYAAAHENVSEGDIISSPSILHNIYGGGAYGSVGTFTFNSSTHETTCAANTGTTNITITGGTIGTDGHENGMVFGASRGDVSAPGGDHDQLAWVDNTIVVIGTSGQGTTLTTPQIKGSVYGGGENGHTYHDASVTIHSGMVGITETMATDPTDQGGALYPYRGNVYGGGCGTDTYKEGNEDKFNPIAGIVQGKTTVLIDGGHVVRDVYGAGAMGSVTGSTNVTIAGNATIGAEGSGGGYVFAAARGENGQPTLATVGSSNLTISGGTVWMDAYGGGQNGYVNGAVTVNLTGGTVKRDVYGGGALAKTNTVAISEGVYPATNVTLTGTTIAGDLYGGGLGSNDVAADVNGPVTVSISGGKAANVFGCNNLNGAPKSTVAVTISGTDAVATGSAIGNVYGGGNQAAYTGSPTVTVSGGTVNQVYGGGLGATAIVDGNTSVTISGTAVIGNDVFGGGSQADVTGSVDVRISGGTVTNDVYGGGALANTNTDNWDGENSRWNDTSTGTYYAEVKHLTVGTSPVSSYWIRTGGAGTPEDPYTYAAAAGTAAAGTKYYKKLEGFLNVAANGTTYKTSVSLTGGIIGNAYGGGLGQLTAGGEFTGEGAVKAMVYGDVSVTVNSAAFTKEVEPSAKNAPVTGRVFGCNNVNGTPKGKVTVIINATRRIDNGEHTLGEFEIQGVYGGGNLADYEPQTYDVDTEFGQNTKVIINNCEASISKVYGGGNAARVPFTDVTVNGAFEIGYVFGGGNGGDMIYKNGSWLDNTGANVTGHTNVLLRGGTIGQAFGGSDSRGTVGGSDIRQETGGFCPLRLVNMYGAGNGEEASSAGDITVTVSGCGENNEIQNVYGGSYKANITGNVTLNIKSGIFTSVFGGNDRRGSIGGNITVNIEETDDCDKPIIIQNLYGGCYQTAYPGESNQDTHTPAKDKSGNDFTKGKITVNVKSATRIDRIFGGSERGEVTGDTEVNINMVRGSMSGHSNVTLPSYYTVSNHPDNITVNPAMGWISAYAYIPTPEEISAGTARERSSVEGYYTRDVYTAATGTAVAEVTYYQESDGDYTVVSPAPTVGADVTSYYTQSEGDYTVVHGQAKKGFSYWKQVVQGSIAAKIGTIGNVYGGGNIGKVDGSTVVNIGTVTTVTMETVADNTATEDVNEHTPKVLGARITGDVYGGCNNAVVTGNTVVNICTADYTTPPADFEGINIEKGSVYGGGCEGDVLGNTFVTMSGGYVFNGIFGGGYSGSVGTFTTSTLAADADVYGHTAHTGCIGKPISCATGTGKCTVVVDGNTQIGPVTVATQGMPIPQGWVWGGGCGIVEDPATHPDTHFKTYVGSTDVTIGGNAFIMEGIIGGGEFGRVLGNTLVKIEGGQIGVGANQTETVGGVLKPKRYTDAQWTAAATAVTSGDASAINTAAASMPECSHYPYGRNIGTVESPNWVYRPYDPYFKKYNSPAEFAPASTDDPSDGKTWIGVVFGGGSGYMPYEKADGSGYDWCRSAGWVEGNTEVQISGGHILTNVYGGNEYTDVKGTCTVKMTGGTIGVPRTLQQISEHPVTCYLFGAGKGDQRSHFNNMTNVGSVEVEVSGGIVYGSVFGGSEDGHVLGNTNVTIKDGAWIGTWGTSYVDGNIFGGGRGFSGENLSAGTIVGNAEVNIKGGTMLGSIYGGGRMASVGVNFSNAQDPSTGQFIEDEGDKTYGHVTINISGGTIGNDTPPADGTYSNSTHSGNVFGGSMGRLTLLDNTPNSLWTRLAQVKTSTINITGNSTIKSNVYGGAEFGTTRDNVYVTVGGTRAANGTITPAGSPVINGSVFGGGYGSVENDATYLSHIDAGTTRYLFTPMQYAGCVGHDTYVNVVGGQVEKNVYGGGQLASVGVIDYSVKEDANGDITYDNKTYSYINAHKHADIQGEGTSEKVYGFGLSWPYEFKYLLGGKATVNITGGHIGSTTWDDRTGYVFGGSKGQVAFKKKVKNNQNVLVEEDITDIHEQRYTEAFCANVRETAVNINYGSTPTGKTPSTIGAEDNCIMGAVYGGGEDGHVYENTAITFTNGLTGLSIYGGGKGEGTYTGTKYVYNETSKEWTKTDNVAGMPSWTAGKVYGNTSITMTGGHVMGNVYGGGNLGSVGKGNYAGGTDDYFPAGYGETLQNDVLWTKTTGFDPDAPITDSNKPTSMADHFLSSGKCTINITGGKVGTLNGLYGYVYGTSNGTPTGMIFGGSRGRAAQDVGALSPRYYYAPDFFLGYVNNTEVTIGTRNAATGPTIYSQVFGGGRDGHVRGSAKVEINAGTIGQTYAESGTYSDEKLRDYQRYHRGNVYGSGSGLGTWDNGTHHGQSSGSVTRHTTVDIYGGTIYNNVYGGGAMASVGPPKITMPDYADQNWSKCTVNIYGGKIGDETDYENHKYGGCVFGASRGGDFATGEKTDDYATTIWNEVNIMPHPTDRTKDAVIAGDVYGGGQASCVKKDNVVNLTGGTIKHDAYGGGKGTESVAADVGGDVLVELNKAVAVDVKGCVVDKIFGCNDLNGTPKGHVTVHVYATQNKNTNNILTKVTPPDFSPKRNTSTEPAEGYLAYLRRILDVTYKKNGEGEIIIPHEYIDNRIVSDTITAVETFYTAMNTKGEASLTSDDKNAINNRANNVVKQIDKMFDYDVTAVYGGGDLAMYRPYGPDANNTDADYKATTQTTDVIIEGCDVTSIKQVYGGGNAASVPSTNVTVSSVFVIDELFGGGNGFDNYQLSDGKWYANPGANVGYYATEEHVINNDDEAHNGSSEEKKYPTVAKVNSSTKEDRETYYSYGTGHATTTVTGGRIHTVYGGSNEKGNIRTVALSQYQKSGTCPLITNETYGGSKTAEMDGEIQVILDCVEDGGTYYGGSQNADINNNVTINITNGTYNKVYGGNNKAGTIDGVITINVEEKGCTPIFIGELYGGGFHAPYSVYGYQRDGEGKLVTVDDPVLKDDQGNAIKNRIPLKAGDTGALAKPHRDPHINIISATRIGTIFGGGEEALVVGSPHINVNMTQGKITANYANNTDSDGKYTSVKDAFTQTTHGTGDYAYTVESVEVGKDATLAIGKIGTIYGGGNLANIIGNTYVDIGTGEWLNDDGEIETSDADGKIYVYNESTKKWDWRQVIEGATTTGTSDTKPEPARNAAFITGSVYGGGNLGHVGDFTLNDVGKPVSCVEGTGECHVTVSNGSIGPDDMLMTKENGPDDTGYVFGAGKGTVDLTKVTGDSEEEKLIALGNIAFVDSTEVIINGNAFIKGSVYGGGYDGHVLHNTGVKISGNCQIGNGFVQMDNDGNYLNNPLSMNRPYTEDEWREGKLITVNDRAELKTLVESTTNYNSSLPECSSWPYGRKIIYGDNEYTVYAPYDMFAMPGTERYPDDTPDALNDNPLTQGGRQEASDGHTFYGNVFGGGSGYFPYAAGKWLETAGQVEGNTWVEITGGHILTNIYGGNELTNVLGDAHISFGGTATLGVPRTLGQIAKHPVTCYLFGAGKGDTRVFFNKMTNVKDVHLNINGGTIYGSVFGGGEDGHVMGNVYMNINEGANIGTWGTSYVDGNVFGGGRGFTGDAYTAGNVAGSVTMNITGGRMLGSIYGGGRLGSVGYGLYLKDETGYGEMREDTKMDDGTDAPTTPTKMFPKGRGHVEVNISGGTIGNDYEYKNYTFNIDKSGKTIDEINAAKDAALAALKATDNIPNTDFEQVDSAKIGESMEYTYTYRLKHTKGGNVFAGGMGRREKLDGTVINYTGIEWPKLGNVKSTKLTISGDAWIMGNVYGGGEIGAVRPFKDTSSETVQGGTTTIDIQGGTIGTEITGGTLQKATITVPESGNSDVKYTFGSVFGGGYGTEVEINEIDEHNKVNKLGALVEGNTYISMSAGHVRASVYGGGELAGVEGDTDITISGGEIGRNEVNKSSDNPGYVMFGGMTMGNVYGGGKGDESHTLVGVVKGNTKVTIEDNVADATYAAAHDGVSAGDVISPKIYHNVYGGGANGSVGTFIFSNGVGGTQATDYMKTVPKGIPLIWTANTGKATVNIKGGTIGISGRDNGMVDGSSRGGIAKPSQTIMGGPDTYVYKDPYDKMAWVESSIVNIGTEGATTGPHIKGSVYGGGENGHVFTHATVNVKSGTIGIVDEEDPWFDFGDPKINEAAWTTRGNVYGAGCGTDMYDSNNDGIDDTHNAWAGCVIGNTDINISGGLVAQNVYGGGSMGSVGRILEGNNIVKHENVNDGFALSWPVKFVYEPLTVEDPVEHTHVSGKTTINITGGRIGTTGSDNGDVFGGTRGEAGDRYEMAQFANVRETEVNINYPNTPTDDNLIVVENIEDGSKKFSLRVKEGVDAICGSVYGGCENGHVNENTSVTLQNGLIGHAIYGGGKGKGTYEVELDKIGGGGKYSAKIYSITAGKVYGNTEITMTGGHVIRNIYGGGNMGSIGKGNYASGTDDYYPAGYGEKINGNLWTSGYNPDSEKPENDPVNVKDNAWYFLNSGKTKVEVTGGVIGYIVDKVNTDVYELDGSNKPTISNKFGALFSASDAKKQQKLFKVLAKDDLPLGNIFGGCRGESAPNIMDSPRYQYCPAFFSGYVNETDVKIGKARDEFTGDGADAAYAAYTGPRIFGSVYGGGQDGHVRRDTKVTVNKGEIGIPYTTDYQGIFGTNLDGQHWLHRGNVYGSGSGIGKYEYDLNYNGKTTDDNGDVEIVDYENPISHTTTQMKEEDYSTSAGSVTRFTDVNINDGIIHRNVYGGGSVASVGPATIPPTRQDMADKKGDTTEGHGPGWQSQTTVTIKGTVGTPDGYGGDTNFKYNPVYGGEVYGASRGENTLDATQFGTTVWTLVKIKNGATIMNNVFGGGDAGMVKKDSEVIVGD